MKTGKLKKTVSLMLGLSFALSLSPMAVSAGSASAASVDTGDVSAASTSDTTDTTEVWDGTIAESFAGGSGTESDPYQISNGAELALMAQKVNEATSDTNSYSSAYYILTDDIVLNDSSVFVYEDDGHISGTVEGATVNEWVSIGTPFAYSFTGNFDGQNHTISGIYQYIESGENNGLFGTVTGGGTIQNVGVIDSYMYTADSYLGGIVGEAHSSLIKNCYSEATLDGSFYTAGIVGLTAGANTIEDCYNAGYVYSRAGSVGGIVGWNFGESVISNCYNAGTVIGGMSDVGGIVGVNDDSCTVQNCYNKGTVATAGSDNSDFGGIAGKNNYGTVTSSYNLGSVTGLTYTGGIVGYNLDGTIEQCYNSGTASGTTQVGGIAGYNHGEKGSKIATIANCFNTNDVTGDSYVGGITGQSYTRYDTLSISDVYNAGIVTGSSNAASCFGTLEGASAESSYYIDSAAEDANATALTDAEMTASDSFDGFDFDATWSMPGSGDYLYPVLQAVSYAGGAATSSAETGTYTFSGGLGTEENPYRIATAEDLSDMAEAVNGAAVNGAGNLYSAAYYIMTADIQLNDASAFTTENDVITGVNDTAVAWTPIGTEESAFSGTFNGDGHTVSGLYVNAESGNQGLFGYVSGGEGTAVIESLNVADSYVTATSGDNIGAVVGYIEYATVTDCSSSAVIMTLRSSDVGGIAGMAQYTDFTGCSNSGTVTGYNTENVSYGVGRKIAGIAGYSVYVTFTQCSNTADIFTGTYEVAGISGDARYTTIDQCYNTGSITVSDDTCSATGAAGGIYGYTWGETTITNCYNTGAVTGTKTWAFGGIGGMLAGSVTIDSCWNSGLVSGPEGGDSTNNAITGYGGTKTNCYYLDTSTDTEGEEGTALTASQLAEQASFSGFDFDTVWTMGEEYPVLQFAVAASEPETADYTFSGGSGTEEDPYILTTAEDLSDMAEAVNGAYVNAAGEYYRAAYYTMANDIALNDASAFTWENGTVTGANDTAVEWVSIGTADSPFSGSFDGGGYTVSGLYVNAESDNQGLFGYVSGGEGTAVIQSVSVADSYLTASAGNNIGAVVGYIEYATVTDCSSSAVIMTLRSSDVGGIAGMAQYTDFAGCSNSGSVTCYNTENESYGVGSKIAGIAGYSVYATFTQCSNTADIYSGTWEVAGISGDARYTTIDQCYNTGDITVSENTCSGTGAAGGIYGYTWGETTITNCYNTGDVTCTAKWAVGGIGGMLAGSVTMDCCWNSGLITGPEGGDGTNNAITGYGATKTNCYYLDTSTDTEGESGTALTADQMADPASFSGFDFDTIWTMGIGHPVLQFAVNAGECPFTDISEGQYFYDAVDWAYTNSIVYGTSDTEFSPYGTCTRAQFMCYLYRVAGEPDVTTTTTSFTDVNEDAYYYDAVLWAVENGITAGTSATTFEPNTAITCAQAVTFLYRYAGSPEVSSTSSFTDVPESAYYADAVIWGEENGIIAGTSATEFSPYGTCTRAQAVTFLYRDIITGARI